MTTNLFVIANVKQLGTYVVLVFYCLFFRTSWCVGVLNSAIFLTVFTIGLSLARFWRAFRISGGGGFEHPKPPLGTPLINTNKTSCVLTYFAFYFTEKCGGYLSFELFFTLQKGECFQCLLYM